MIESQSAAGNFAVQQAIAGANYYDCPVAAVVTQSHFTPAAKEQARSGKYMSDSMYITR